MHSDQIRKYGISEFIIQAVIMTSLPTMPKYRACMMESEMPYFLICIKRLVHHAIYCMSCLVSCPFNAIPMYPS